MTAETEVTAAGSARKISMELWSQRLKAFLRYGEPSQKALVCEGEAGCGKSEITKQVCDELGLPPIICPGLGGQQVEEFLALTRLAKDKKGNVKVEQGVLENIIPAWSYVKAGKHVLEVDGKKKVVLPWIIDEVFTGNMGQANQLRAALTFRKIGSVELPAGEYNGMPVGVYIIGTTNPEDVAYSSRRSVDSAVMERISVFRVYMEFEYHQRYLVKLVREGKYPEICRMFLRMDENRDLWNAASPRFWTQGFGQSWMELHSEKSLREEQRMTLFGAELWNQFQVLELRKLQRGKREKTTTTVPETILARFKNFILHGDDPDYYPLSAIAVLDGAGDSREERAQLARIERWRNSEQAGFIGISMQDLAEEIKRMDVLTDKQVAHIANVLNSSGSGFAAQFLLEISVDGGVHKTRVFSPTSNRIYQALESKDVMDRVRDALLKNGQFREELVSERRAGKQIKQAGE